MKRGKNFKFGLPHSSVDFAIAVIGTGAAAPAVPVGGNFTPTTSTFPARANAVSKLAAEIPTRASAGRYTITYEHALPVVYNAQGSVLAAGGAPTGGLLCDVDSINSVTRQIAVRVSTQAGAATDLSSSDMLVITVNAIDSGA